jgi:hypothetical protein
MKGVCAECRTPIMPHDGGGRPRVYCNTSCKSKAARRRRKQVVLRLNADFLREFDIECKRVGSTRTSAIEDGMRMWLTS